MPLFFHKRKEVIMPTGLTLALIVVGLLFLITLIKELFKIVARKTIYWMGKLIGGIFTFIGWMFKTIFRIITAPFALLFGLIMDRT